VWYHIIKTRKQSAHLIPALPVGAHGPNPLSSSRGGICTHSHPKLIHKFPPIMKLSPYVSSMFTIAFWCRGGQDGRASGKGHFFGRAVATVWLRSWLVVILHEWTRSSGGSRDSRGPRWRGCPRCPFPALSGLLLLVVHVKVVLVDVVNNLVRDVVANALAALTE
jgi:hypothetical protein